MFWIDLANEGRAAAPAATASVPGNTASINGCGATASSTHPMGEQRQDVGLSVRPRPLTHHPESSLKIRDSSTLASRSAPPSRFIVSAGSVVLSSFQSTHAENGRPLRQCRLERRASTQSTGAAVQLPVAAATPPHRRGRMLLVEALRIAEHAASRGSPALLPSTRTSAGIGAVLLRKKPPSMLPGHARVGGETLHQFRRPHATLVNSACCLMAGEKSLCGCGRPATPATSPALVQQVPVSQHRPAESPPLILANSTDDAPFDEVACRLRR